MDKRKAKVLLCGFISDGFKSEHRYTLGLGYLKAYAEKSALLRENFDIQVIDFAPGHKDYHGVIENYDPEIIGFSCYLWSVENILEIIARLRVSRPETTIIVGGAAHNLEERASELPDGALLCDGYQEGEGVFRDILSAYIDDKDYSKIAGLWTVKNGFIEKGEPRLPIRNPDDIPCPYSTNAINVPAGCGCFMLETARGCLHACSFCEFSYRRERMRYFSPERIAGQIRWAMNHGVEVVHLLASAVNYDSRRFADLCSLIKETNTGGRLKFVFCMHPAYITRGQIESLKSILPVTDSIVVGIQSLSEKVMETMNRKFSAERLLRGVGLLSGVFHPNVDLIIGLPGETAESFMYSVRALIPFPIHLTIHHLSALPGTLYHTNKEEYGIKHRDSRESYLAISSNTFSEQDYLTVLDSLRESAGSGELAEAGVLSIGYENLFSFERQSRNREEEADEDKGFIEPRLLKIIEPFVRKGVTFQGWTASESYARGASLNVLFRNKDRNLQLILSKIEKDEPCYAKTAHFYIRYNSPEAIDIETERWLNDFSYFISKIDVPFS